MSSKRREMSELSNGHAANTSISASSTLTSAAAASRAFVGTDHAAQLMHKLNTMRSNSMLCDYEIRVNGHSFHCHKFILIATSDFFKAMLSGVVVVVVVTVLHRSIFQL
jgi:hypothetical protein